MKMRGKRGITLIELIVSVSIFSFIMVTVFSMYTFSVVKTYTQTRYNVAHINDVSELEKKSSKYLNLSNKSSNLEGMLYSEAKDVELFKGIDANTTISAQYISNYGGNTKENIVKIIPIDKLDYNDGILGRLGPKFATPLLPQEAKSIHPKYDWQEEDRYTMASYHIDDNAQYGEIGNFRSVKFDLRKHGLPKGEYKFKYFVFSKSTYHDIMGEAGFKKEEALKIPTHKKPLIEKTDLKLKIGHEENVYAHSENSSYKKSNKITNNEALKMPITKNAEKVSQWKFLELEERKKILPAGKYVFVFELYLDKLSGTSESEALARLRRLAHLSKIKNIAEVEGKDIPILRDAFLMESIQADFVVNTGENLYIGSEFEENKMSKISLSSDGAICVNYGNMQNAKYSQDGKRFDIDSKSILVNIGNQSDIYQLSKKDIAKIDKKVGDISKSVKNISYSMSPHTAGRIVSYVVEQNDKLWHSDERYDLEDSFARGIWRKTHRFHLRNNRLFGSPSMNIALLGNGKLIFTDEKYHKLGTNSREFEEYGSSYQDLFVDLLYDYNSPSNRYLGIHSNRVELIETKEKAEDSPDIKNIEYKYEKFKDAKKREMIRVDYNTAMRTDLAGYKFINFHPLSFYQYLIMAEKNVGGKIHAKLFMLSKEYDSDDNEIYVLSETKYPVLNMESPNQKLKILAQNYDRLRFVEGNDSLYAFINDANLGKKLYKVNEEYYDETNHKLVTPDCNEVLTTDSKIMNVYFSNQNE